MHYYKVKATTHEENRNEYEENIVGTAESITLFEEEAHEFFSTFFGIEETETHKSDDPDEVHPEIKEYWGGTRYLTVDEIKEIPFHEYVILKKHNPKYHIGIEVSAADRIRHIAKWMDHQNENYFDDLLMSEIIDLFDLCEDQGVDELDELEGQEELLHKLRSKC
jgi:hypothetical protein